MKETFAWGQTLDSGFNLRAVAKRLRRRHEVVATFGWMPTTQDDRALLSAPERSDQRRQDVVAIFGTMPPEREKVSDTFVEG